VVVAYNAAAAAAAAGTSGSRRKNRLLATGGRALRRAPRPKNAKLVTLYSRHVPAQRNVKAYAVAMVVRAGM